MNERLNRQIDFIREIDKLKTIFRQSYLMDQTRHENDAEHTWHITLMSWLLEEHLEQEKVNLLHVMKMLLVHDLVEIDAGDTFAYDEKGQEGKFERELAAAKRIFGLLPVDQRNEMLSLWLEFEERDTLESRYASAMDRIQPLLHNYFTQGKAWREHGVTSDRVLARIQFMREELPGLYTQLEHLIQDAVHKGYLQT